MSIEYVEIAFDIVSPRLAEIARKYSSETGKSDCILQTEDDHVSGRYYSSEYDEYFDSWEPSKKVPAAGNALQWILDVIKHGQLITEDGQKYIAGNHNDLEEDLKEYEIMHFKCSPEDLGGNYIYLQMYDGNDVVTYNMNAHKWESMWNNRNVERANAIFKDHGLVMDDFSTAKSLIGDTFDYLKDLPVFTDLLEQFGEKSVSEKTIGDESEISLRQIKDLLAELDKWVVSPEEVDYEGIKIDANVDRGSILRQYTSWGERMRIQYFVESCISQLGATVSSGVGAKTDATLLIRKYEDYSKDYDICKYYNINSIRDVTFVSGGEPIVKENLTEKEYYIGQLAVFKSYLEDNLEKLNMVNAKRASKKTPAPPIKIMYEDEWFDFLMKTDKDPAFHESRQKIAKEMIENSPYVGGDAKRIEEIYEAKPEGREFEL